jgi:hypothetical protein
MERGFRDRLGSVCGWLCVIVGIIFGVWCLLVVVGAILRTDSNERAEVWCSQEFQIGFHLKLKDKAETEIKHAVMHASHDLLDVAFAKKDTAFNVLRHYLHLIKCHAMAALSILSSMFDMVLTDLARHSLCAIYFHLPN